MNSSKQIQEKDQDLKRKASKKLLANGIVVFYLLSQKSTVAEK